MKSDINLILFLFLSEINEKIEIIKTLILSLQN